MAGLGDIVTGVMQKKSLYKEADALNQKAKARRAEGNAAAREERRQGRIAQSRALAVAAASGGGVSDPTVVNIMGDIGADAEYRALTRVYESEEEAQGLNTAASIRKRQGRTALLSSAISGAESLSTKYG